MEDTEMLMREKADSLEKVKIKPTLLKQLSIKMIELKI